MTGTSKALKRLGVAGLSTALMSTGLAAFAATAANAVVYPTTTATSVAISPTSSTGANGECNQFTLTVNASASVSVNIQETVPSSTAASGTAIGFCQPLASNPDAGPSTATAGPGTAGANTTAGTTAASPATAAASCHNTALTDSTHTSNVSCDTSYTDTNGDGKIVIGVASNTPGSMPIVAFGDANANGAQDVGEAGASATKTWAANPATPANTDTVTCTPASQSNATNQDAFFTCTAKDSAGNALAGITISYGVSSGPDKTYTDTCGPTQTGANGTTAGTTPANDCDVDNSFSGQPGHDVVNVWIDTNGTPGQQTGEPSTTITMDWITAAANGSQVTVTCSPNQVVQIGTAPNQDSVCQNPTTVKTVTYTATVVNGTPSTPQAGVLVQWIANWDNNGGGTGEPASEVETISATSCITAANGQCSITQTDPTPTEGESIGTLAFVTRQDSSESDAEGFNISHDPTSTYGGAPANSGGEARNVTVTPATSSQQSGGVQSFTGKVTDRFGNPVAGDVLNWSESGPGSFRGGANAAQCTTDSTGQCSVDVTSLSTETGDETVTATISTLANAECASTAGFSVYDAGHRFNAAATAPGQFSPTGITPSANGQNNKAPTATTAGNCAASGKATWTAGSPTGAASVTVAAPAGKVGNLETATATVKDAAGAAVANAVVQFTVTGANNASGSATTNASGQATFSYTPANAGTDTINAIVNNGTTNPSGHTTASIAPRAAAKHHISATITCKSPRPHVLRCVVHVSPAKSGLSVSFWRKTASGPVKIGSARTNSSGVAVLVKKNLKSKKTWKVFARVAGSGTTFPATTGTSKVIIK